MNFCTFVITVTLTVLITVYALDQLYVDLVVRFKDKELDESDGEER